MQNWYTEFSRAFLKVKKKGPHVRSLKKSYAGLRGVWIAGRILYAGKLFNTFLNHCLTT